MLAAFSVTQYACFLVNSEAIVGQQLVDTLNGFLLKVSILAFIIAGLFHYFTVKRIVEPIKHLSKASKDIQEGKIPSNISMTSSGEILELIENFNSMSETLMAAQEQRNNMLRDIAHELRTPLTNMNGYLEALKNNVIEGNADLFGSLLEESRRITRIVELLTELNSWEKGNYFSDKQFNIIKIDRVLKDTITSFQLKMQEKFQNISIHVDEAAIVGNSDGLIQAFSNILQNILDYNTGDELEILAVKKDKTCRITFSHTGQFINHEKKDLIFERFYRLEESRSTKSHGAGLGLAIAKSIILAHEGNVELETDGTHHKFKIEFPLKEKYEYRTLEKEDS